MRMVQEARAFALSLQQRYLKLCLLLAVLQLYLRKQAPAHPFSRLFAQRAKPAETESKLGVQGTKEEAQSGKSRFYSHWLFFKFHIDVVFHVCLEYDELRQALKAAVAAKNWQEASRICTRALELAAIIDPQQMIKVFCIFEELNNFSLPLLLTWIRFSLFILSFVLVVCKSIAFPRWESTGYMQPFRLFCIFFFRCWVIFTYLQYQKALEDANHCVRLNPNVATGYCSILTFVRSSLK